MEPELDALRAAGERDATMPRVERASSTAPHRIYDAAVRPTAAAPRRPPLPAHRPPERCVRASRGCARAQRQSRPIYRACHVCGLCLLAVLGVGLVPAVVYFPHVPEYTVCNKAVDWSSIFRGLANMTVREDVDVLLSIANPVHSLEVSAFDADFFYEERRWASREASSRGRCPRAPWWTSGSPWTCPRVPDGDEDAETVRRQSPGARLQSFAPPESGEPVVFAGDWVHDEAL